VGALRIRIGRFLAWAAVLLAAATYFGMTPSVDPVRRATAYLAWWAADAAGLESTLVGARIYTSNRILDVAVTCIPLNALAVMAALVLATETSVRNRLWGLLAGVIALFLTNVIRVALVILTAEKAPAAFDFVHESVLTFVPLVVAFSVWLLWTRSLRA
jgi:exosortase/archaeosortase family protein